MKKLLALAALALFSLPAAKAQYLLTIDLSDINNVVITSTGLNPSANDSSFTPDVGFTLLGFFTAPSDIFAGATTSNLVVDGLTEGSFYDGAYANDYEGGIDTTDLTILSFGSGDQIFSTTLPAFTGTMTLNFEQIAGLLPAINHTGIIQVGSGTATVGPVIGEYRVVPEPSSLLLITAAGVALLVRRRRTVA